MLSAASTLFLAAAALWALAVIADSLIEARAAWERLLREGEALRKDIAVPARVAREPRKGTPTLALAPGRMAAKRRPAGVVLRPLQACAA